MSSSPPSHGRPSSTPLSLFNHTRRVPSLPEALYAPPTSPLSPFSTSPLSSTPPPPTSSHYYRPPRSTLTSPTRSNISSPGHSPTRSSSRQSRIQSLLATDPLLSRLTPVTISRLSASADFDFTPAEKEWSLRAAEGAVKVNEWLREVEGWCLAWRRGCRGSKDTGDGYLPPTDRPKKRRKTGMVSIEEEEEEGVLLDGSRPVRRKLFVDGSDGVVGSAGPPMRRLGKPRAPHQLEMQRQKAGQELISPLRDTPQCEEEEGQVSDQETEAEDDEEYWGSLKKSTIEAYEARIEIIKVEVEELDVDGLKGKVLSYRTGIANPLTDSSAIITATTLQLLPPLSRLTKLLSVWAVRIAVLRVVPIFLRWLQIAKDALEAGYTAINHPSINPNIHFNASNGGWRGLEEESYALMQETITQKVATAGRLMDAMLDALEGREDVLPDKWIAELEEVEEGVSRWEMDGERVVLEGRLRLEEIRMVQNRHVEEVREREKTLLVQEQERSALEARAEEDAAMGVMGKAEETDRQLREALELNDIVAEAIELPDDDENDWIEVGSEREEMGELLSRLESVEKERQLTGEDEVRGRSVRRERSFDMISPPNGHNHREPPDAPAAADPLAVEEIDEELFPLDEGPELPVTNGLSLANGLFSISRAPRPQAMVNVTSTPPEANSGPNPTVSVVAMLPDQISRPQISPPEQDEDERIRRRVTAQMEQRTLQESGTNSEPRAAIDNFAKEEEEDEEERKLEQEDLAGGDEAIHLKIAQQMEQTVASDSSQSTQAEAGASREVPFVEPGISAVPPQSEPPRTSSKSEDDFIHQQITQEMGWLMLNSEIPQPEVSMDVQSESHKQEPVIETESPKTTLPNLPMPEEPTPHPPKPPVGDEEIRCQIVQGMEQLMPARPPTQPLSIAVEPAAQPSRQIQPSVSASLDDGARCQGQQGVQQQPVSTVSSAQSSAESRVGCSSPSQSTVAGPVAQPSSQQVQAPANPPLGDEAIRRQVQEEMQKLIDAGNAAAATTAIELVKEVQLPALGRQPSQPVIQDVAVEVKAGPSSQPVISCPSALIDSAEDERIRHQIVRLMDNLIIRDGAPAVEEQSQQPPNAAHTEHTTTPVSQEHRAQATEEQDTAMAKAEMRLQPQQMRPTATQSSVNFSQEDEEIRRKVTAEMEESLKGEQAVGGTEDTSLAIDREQESRGAEERRMAEAEAEHKRLVEERAREAESCRATKPDAGRPVEEEELAEKARLEQEAERAAEAERILLIAEVVEREKDNELDRLAEAERQRLAAQRREEEEAAAAEKALEERRTAEVERAAVVEAARQISVREPAAFSDSVFQDFDRQRRLAEDERVRMADLALAEREERRNAEQEAGRIRMERDIEEARIRVEKMREEQERRERALSSERLHESEDWGGQSDMETGSVVTAPDHGDDSASDAFETAVESEDELDYSEVWKAQTGYVTSGYETPRALDTPPLISGEEANGVALVEAIHRGLEAVSNHSESFDCVDEHASFPFAQEDASINRNSQCSEKNTPVFDQPSPPPPTVDSTPVGASPPASPPLERGNGNSPRDGPFPSSVLAHGEVSETSSDMDSSGDGGSEKDGGGAPPLIAESAIAAGGTEPDIQAGELALEDLSGLFAQKPSLLVSSESRAQVDLTSQDRIEYIDDEDFSLSQDYSFGTPSILIAPSTPQEGNSYDLEDDFIATPRGHSMSPISLDGRSGSFTESPFSYASVGEVDQSNLSMSDSVCDLDQEDTSEFDIEPVATSTPKPSRRLTVNTGLDSITEILTPRSTIDEYFKESDVSNICSAGGPDVGDTLAPNKPWDKALAGDVVEPEKITKREFSRDPMRVTSASRNRAVPARSSTSTLGKGAPKDQKRFSLRSSSPVSTTSVGYKRPPSRAQEGRRPSSRASSVATPTMASEARPNSSTPIAGPAHAIKPIRRLRRDTISSEEDSDVDEPGRFLRDNTPDMADSPDFARAPKLSVTKRHIKQPSNFTSLVTPEKRQRFQQSPYTGEGSSLVLPATPILQADLDDKINTILGSLPSKVRLTASNLQKLSETGDKRQPLLKPFDLTPTGIPAPRSTGSTPSVVSEVPSYARPSSRRHYPSSPGDIKLYHLHRSDGLAPIKLYIRLVGEAGERVMVRVGGGWADLAEYLREYATHHGSKRRVVSEGRVEIQDLSSLSYHGHTLHPSRSISSFRSASPGPMGSRPSSPLPGGRQAAAAGRSSPAFGIRRPESPMLVKRSESPTPHVNAMRGGHNGTLSAKVNTGKSSPTTPTEKSFPTTSRAQLTPGSHGSPPSRPGSRPGSSSSAYRRPTSRLSFTESAFDDYVGSVNGYSPPPPLPKPALGLAGPRGKHVQISPENQAWVEGMLGQVRKASSDRRATLLSAAGQYADMDEPEGGLGGREFGGKLGEMGKAGVTRRMFPKM